MTSDAVLIMKTWWTIAIKALTSIVLPGTNNVTPLSALFFVASTAIAIKFLTRLFGLGSVDDAVKTYRRDMDTTLTSDGRAKVRK